MENHKVKILVCCHKEAYVPNDDIYLPIHVGKAISKVFRGMMRETI